MVKVEIARPNGIDFVVVCTPNTSHYEICKCFLKTGIHVVCDKPLTIEKADAQELERLANESRLVLAVTYSYTYHVTLRTARALIDDQIPAGLAVRAGFGWQTSLADRLCTGRQIGLHDGHRYPH